MVYLGLCVCVCVCMCVTASGENESVSDALLLPRIQGRGLRVLALDGGGMKGITLVVILRAIQARLPRPIHTYWDLVVRGIQARSSIVPALDTCIPYQRAGVTHLLRRARTGVLVYRGRTP